MSNRSRSNQPVESYLLTAVHISDLHLFADASGELLGCVTEDSFRAVLAAAVEIHPDVVFVTGDVAQDGSPEAYARAAAACEAFAAPVYWMPGNHDHREAMETALNVAGPGISAFFEQAGWRFMQFDSQVEGQVYGSIDGTSIERARSDLRRDPDTATCLLLHHHPMPVGSEWLNPLGLRKGDSFLRLVDEYPCIKAVLFGHIHQAFEAERGSARLFGVPSSSIQFVPRAPSFAIDNRDPGYRVLTFRDDGRIQTRIERVPTRYRPPTSAVGY